MNDWRYRLAEHRGTLIAIAIFALMFVIYISNHPAGLTANVVNTAANKGTSVSRQVLKCATTRGVISLR